MAASPEIHSLFPASPLQRMEDAPRQLPTYRGDVVVVGTGVAGLSAALGAADSGLHVLVLSKGKISNTNTSHAQGGVAAAMGEEDSAAFHGDDTLQVGCGLAEPSVVDAITEEAPQAIRWLQSLGMRFDLEADGSLSMGKEGGHRAARILHSGGTLTGREFQRVLGNHAKNHPRVDIIEGFTAVELLKDAEGEVAGILGLMGAGSSGGPAGPAIIEAREVVMATGGGGQIFRETTNPESATGDGLAMALRAGAELQDVEFTQFHPTILYLAGAARFLISEVTRGAGAVLRDRTGAAFMESVHSDAELAPRDIVSRGVFRKMVETGDTHVYLDFSRVPNPANRFPELARITGVFGIDLEKDSVPVRPAVHYFVGGIRADLEGRTSLPGLRATGECAATGFHGANRMGSNSLLEGLVHGRRVGRALGEGFARADRRPLLPPAGTHTKPEGADLHLLDMTYSLKSLMWRQVGVEREKAGLEDAMARLEAWEGYLAHLGPFTPAGVEIANMVQVAQALTLAALFRKETRGTHFRTDHPSAEDSWRCHTVLTADAGGLHIRSRPTSVLEGSL